MADDAGLSVLAIVEVRLFVQEEKLKRRLGLLPPSIAEIPNRPLLPDS